MATAKQIEERTTALVTPILESNSFELVDVEYVKEAGSWYLRAFIDKPGGITIDDCELVSRALSDKLDENDFIDDAYILEVSSPGLTRPLKKPKDYERNLGKPIDIRLFRAVGGCKEYSEVLLTAYTDDTVTVTTESGTVELERKNISMIRQSYVEA
ncbi:MAG: ribosome maturation factor RimP [Lachnospiraceae bacterium]|nr:ribosome maturation factor RimP [Lachnospiraceae bacterium]